MIISTANLKGLFSGFSTAYNQGFEGAQSYYRDFAMIAPSSTRELTYGWMGRIPAMREWLGDRVIQNLGGAGFTIVNRDFELSVSVGRNDIEDDQYGVFAPLMREMGREAAEHPDRLIFNLLRQGWNTPCYDGQNFFSTTHPVLDRNGNPINVANTDLGTGAPWFLLDTSRAIRPIIFQERKPFDFVALTDPRDEPVFMRKEFVYGVDGRSNVGFGLWQLAWGSKQPLNATNYATARAALHAMRGDHGGILGVRPTTLIVPASLEQAAMKLINNDRLANGEANEWQNSAKLIITPWLDN